MVSLEAIFLSTFVMIGQNRQSEQAKADHDFVANELELQNNTKLTQMVADLIREIHQSVCQAASRPLDSPASKPQQEPPV